ncbi:NAD-dependent epimerase/dehydratase family protein [Mycobacterium avium]|uniref:Dihydroflavonol-4-reductase family protein n=1 Tax=Mycobacterium avium (strain 104) TaxID=243243 RepID=A0A0H3A0B5_MYCA1|nr:NAD-dependent epimerase/dehydratase family protein [Mycobacterium avium]TXA39355.1 NAD-dependent dehydratase [Mycobacterium tuberculosis variant bovis]ABK67408.1 dihydroflavonol-4-reductase family protein [Mycobacterium avium 104]MBZ4507900.1 NAD-dependent epimerase/dehydratase family protein [Mycobacterium avium subsp. hominissuis]MBZ4517411.1 NAD-dependent epimerase/dehydratase family protein [Mycobacterium avium subsp. hominissuis]MBZ4527322.1 NAD-dependent epimerase/dehydratase family p
MAVKLVIGASGFLGSHVTRQLVERGERVRVLLRRTSSTVALDDLDIERRYGDVFDDAVLRDALDGCDDVYYCVVDTRAWLRDPAPLFRTNVEGLRQVLDTAVGADLRRFVFTSTIGTIALSEDGLPVSEDEPFNWADRGGGYIRSRVEAENLVLQYARERGLPAVAMCVSNTYGPGDFQPTPHGSLVAAAGKGKMPVYVKDMSMEVVGIEDAARALILAAEKGRVGERYIVSERYISARELYTTAAEAGGARPPRIGIPLKVMYALGLCGDVAAKVLRRDMLLSTLSVRLMHIMSPMDHSKAERELGWRPEPIHDAIRRAVAFYQTR